MRRLAPLLALTVLTACASNLPHATDAQVTMAGERWPGTTRASLAQGRDLYVSRCSGCHTLHLPSERRPDSWPEAVADMAKRAKLLRDQQDLVTRYLVTVSTPTRTP